MEFCFFGRVQKMINYHTEAINDQEFLKKKKCLDEIIENESRCFQPKKQVLSWSLIGIDDFSQNLPKHRRSKRLLVQFIKM